MRVPSDVCDSGARWGWVVEGKVDNSAMINDRRLSSAHRTWLQRETRALLSFARGAEVTRGFGWLGDTGSVLTDRPQPLWITARMTHVFALGSLIGEPDCTQLCDHGVRSMLEDFADSLHGGWFAEINAGRPCRTDKEAYSFAFVVLALSSATVAGRASARDALRQCLALVEQHFWCEAEGACCESYDRTWQQREEYRGANANMHMVEAFLAAADATAQPIWIDRALRICDLLINRHARAQGWRVVEHFDGTWTPLPDYNIETKDHPFRPYGATPGHALEWARLLLCLRAAIAHPPEWLLEAARGLFERAVGDGWKQPGGIVYTTDFSGVPVVDKRLHWVIAEGIAAAAVLHAGTGDDVYETWYGQFWDFAELHLMDRTYGSWHHELDARLMPVQGTWSGKPDIYHAFQATLVPRLPIAPSIAAALRDGLLQ